MFFNLTMKEVLARIGMVRNSANLSAREVSMRMGMSPQYLSKVESGKTTLTMEKLLDVLRICNYPIDKFFSEDPNEFDKNLALMKKINSIPSEKRDYLLKFLD